MDEVSGSAIAGSEKFKTEQTLVCLLHACKGYTTTVELVDESSIYGKIIHVDGFMNITMVRVIFTQVNGRVQKFDEIFIQGTKIRFVHLPDEIDIRSAIREQLDAINKTRNRPARTPRRGMGRGARGGRGGIGGRGGRGASAGRGGRGARVGRGERGADV